MVLFGFLLVAVILGGLLKFVIEIYYVFTRVEQTLDQIQTGLHDRLDYLNAMKNLLEEMTANLEAVRERLHIQASGLVDHAPLAPASTVNHTSKRQRSGQ